MFFGEFLQKYAELWTRVAERLARFRSREMSVDDVAEHVNRPCLSLEPLVAEEPRSWSLQYTFDFPDEEDIGYFVEFKEWEIVSVIAVD